MLAENVSTTSTSSSTNNSTNVACNNKNISNSQSKTATSASNLDESLSNESNDMITVSNNANHNDVANSNGSNVSTSSSSCSAQNISTSNNSLTLSVNNATSPTINLRQFSPNSADSINSINSMNSFNLANSPNSLNKGPPPLPPLPANLPSKFYLLNQQNQSKISNLDQVDSSIGLNCNNSKATSNENNPDTFSTTLSAIINQDRNKEVMMSKIHVDTDTVCSDVSSAASSLQASPVGKQQQNQATNVEFNLSTSSTYYSYIDNFTNSTYENDLPAHTQQHEIMNPSISRNDERSASFIIDSPQKCII